MVLLLCLQKVNKLKYKIGDKKTLINCWRCRAEGEWEQWKGVNGKLKKIERSGRHRSVRYLVGARRIIKRNEEKNRKKVRVYERERERDREHVREKELDTKKIP